MTKETFKISWYTETDIKEKIDKLKKVYNIKCRNKMVENLVNREIERFK